MGLGSYTIHYDGLSGDEKRAKAMEDIVNYLGDERFSKIDAKLRKYESMELEQLRIMLSFAGVQGYPVRAWYESIWGEA